MTDLSKVTLNSASDPYRTAKERGWAITDASVLTAPLDPEGVEVTSRPVTTPTSASGSVTIDVLANDSDPDGDVLTARIVTEPQHGDLSLNADGSFEYIPAADFTFSRVLRMLEGRNDLVVTATDEAGNVATAEDVVAR